MKTHFMVMGMLPFFFWLAMPGSAKDFPIVNFNLKRGGYSQFLTELRNKVPSSGKSHGVKVLYKEISDTFQRYLLVKLKGENPESITLALNATNLYVIGFRVKNTVYYFSEDEKVDPTTNVFSDKAIKREDRHFIGNGNYAKMHFKLGDQGIGMAALKNNVESLYNMERKPKTERYDISRKHVLGLCIMISEAARFIPIQNEVYLSLDKNKKLTAKSIDLINKWQPISEAVQSENPADLNTFCGIVIQGNTQQEVSTPKPKGKQGKPPSNPEIAKTENSVVTKWAKENLGVMLPPSDRGRGSGSGRGQA